MNNIHSLKPIHLYSQTHALLTPSFKGEKKQPVQNQTQLCSSDCSRAVSEQMKVLIDLNSKEKFLNKNYTVPQVQKNLNALYAVSEFIENTPALSRFDLTYEDLCEKYFEGLKYGLNTQIDVKEQTDALKKLAELGENPRTKELFKKIGSEALQNIVCAGVDAVFAFDKKTFDVYNKLFNDKSFRPFLKNRSADKILSSLFQGDDTDTMNKNLKILKKLMKNKRYAFVKKMNPDFDILRYKGDLNKFFEKLKSYNDRLLGNQTLKFIIDPVDNEAVISVTDEVSKDFVIRKRDVYDINMKKISRDSSVIGRNKNNILVQNTRVDDYKNNTTYHIRQYCDDKNELHDASQPKQWFFDRQIKEVKDSQGRVIKREIIKESGIDGALNIKTIDENGKIHTLAKAYKNPDGSVYIEKNMKSPEGYTTRIRYKKRLGKDGIQNAEIMDYTVYDSEGREIAKRENILQKINNFLTESYKNGEKHNIFYTGNDKIKVVNQTTGTITELNLKELIRGDDEQLKAFFKTLSGSTLETLNDTIASVVKAETMSSQCIPESGYLETAPNRFILEHEKGHIKSYRNGNVSQNSKTPLAASLLKGNEGRLSTDSELLKIYNEEKQRFLSSYPRRIRNFAQYYNDSVHLKKYGGIEEVFSDIEAVLNEALVPKEIIKRVHLLQENFPKTAAYIIKRKI